MIDSKTIEKFKKGKRSGFNKIYEAYSSGMYAICLRYVRCDDDAQEVLQESFIKVFNNRDKYDDSYPIGSWIKTITIRTALNFIREHYRLKLTEDEGDFDQAVFQDETDQEQLDMKERLKMALGQLPEGYRTVFNLYVVDNLTHQEIADYLNISVGTSKSQYFKAKKMIQKLLKTERLAS